MGGAEVRVPGRNRSRDGPQNALERKTRGSAYLSLQTETYPDTRFLRVAGPGCVARIISLSYNYVSFSLTGPLESGILWWARNRPTVAYRLLEGLFWHLPYLGVEVTAGGGACPHYPRSCIERILRGTPDAFGERTRIRSHHLGRPAKTRMSRCTPAFPVVLAGKHGSRIGAFDPGATLRGYG